MTRILFFLFIISALINIFLIRNDLIHTKKISIKQTADKEYPFLSKRIFAENQNDLLINFVKLRDDLRKFDSNTSTPIGIYFEYLPSGTSIGINEKKEFVLASLLKVPLAMAVYKEIDIGRLKHDQELTIKEENLDSFWGDLWKRGAGEKITVDEALKLMLEESDNTAKSVLFNAVTPGSLEDVFDYLDIPKQVDQDTAVVTAKNYSSVLRSLYLSSYLPKNESNEILNILTMTKYGDWMPKELPREVKVAHKVGVYDPNDPNKSIYTDCGIVYLPKRPYILCIMVRDSQKNALSYIREISKTVYNYVASANK